MDWRPCLFGHAIGPAAHLCGWRSFRLCFFKQQAFVRRGLIGTMIAGGFVTTIVNFCDGADLNLASCAYAVRYITFTLLYEN